MGIKSRQKRNMRAMKQAWEAQHGPMKKQRLARVDEAAQRYGEACGKCGQGIPLEGAPVCMFCVRGWNQ